jgi:hypothetical protein
VSSNNNNELAVGHRRPETFFLHSLKLNTVIKDGAPDPIKLMQRCLANKREQYLKATVTAGDETDINRMRKVVFFTFHWPIFGPFSFLIYPLVSPSAL